MINEILKAAGIPYRRARFAKPPAGAYAVYMDDISTDGPDGLPAMIQNHSLTVELYVQELDGAEEEAMEAAINAHGLPWEKDGAAWDDQTQRYQVNYYFDYVEKRRPTA